MTDLVEQAKNDLEEMKQAAFESALERQRQSHALRMESARLRHSLAMELQTLKNKVAAKQRRESAEAETKRRQEIARLTVQAMRALAEGEARVIERDEHGRVSGVRSVDNSDALELATDLFAEIEKLRNER